MNELSKNLTCICIRNGVEIWVESDRAENLVEILKSPNAPQFIEYDGRMLNKADLVGIFSAEDMESTTRRKNGQWKCASNTWHDRGQKCECMSLEDKKLVQRRDEAIKNCDRKCTNGYIYASKDKVILCECIKSL